MFESLIAAIYLDSGDPGFARDFILCRFIGPEIELAAAGELGGNYKSLLQQLARYAKTGSTPTYHLLDEKGPDHSKCFKIAAQIGRTRFQGAWGRNKKEAEQRAARNALSELNGEAALFLGLMLVAHRRSQASGLDCGGLLAGAGGAAGPFE